MKKSKADVDKVNQIFRSMVEEGIAFEYFYVSAISRDGQTNYLDRAQFKDGEYGYSESIYENVKIK